MSYGLVILRGMMAAAVLSLGAGVNPAFAQSGGQALTVHVEKIDPSASVELWSTSTDLVKALDQLDHGRLRKSASVAPTTRFTGSKADDNTFSFSSVPSGSYVLAIVATARVTRTSYAYAVSSPFYGSPIDPQFVCENVDLGRVTGLNGHVASSADCVKSEVSQPSTTLWVKSVTVGVATTQTDVSGDQFTNRATPPVDFTVNGLTMNSVVFLK